MRVPGPEAPGGHRAFPCANVGTSLPAGGGGAPREEGRVRADHYDARREPTRRPTRRASSTPTTHDRRWSSLAGDVEGRRVLDAGCGSGPLSEDLRSRGAHVSGFDSSQAMLEPGTAAPRRGGGPESGRPQPASAVCRCNLRRRHLLPRAALPRGLDGALGRACGASSSQEDASSCRSTTHASSSRATPMPTTSPSPATRRSTSSTAGPRCSRTGTGRCTP